MRTLDGGRRNTNQQDSFDRRNESLVGFSAYNRSPSGLSTIEKGMISLQD
jgi:hypothetical protein